MLRISKKGDYAVSLMAYLARHGEATRVCSAQEIADHAGLHKSVVANLLKDLTRAGLLESVRGTRGGYRLAAPASEISLRQILEVVEGPFRLVDCARAGGDRSPCTLLSFCPSKRPMQVLHRRIAALLDDVRLPELLAPEPEPPLVASLPEEVPECR